MQPILQLLRECHTFEGKMLEGVLLQWIFVEMLRTVRLRYHLASLKLQNKMIEI